MLIVNRVRLFVMIQRITELGVLGVTSMNAKGIILHSDRRWIVFRLDIPQGNVALVKGAEVSVGEHFSGLPDLTGTR